jgi:hypothetical protein
VRGLVHFNLVAVRWDHTRFEWWRQQLDKWISQILKLGDNVVTIHHQSNVKVVIVRNELAVAKSANQRAWLDKPLPRTQGVERFSHNLCRC